MNKWILSFLLAVLVLSTATNPEVLAASLKDMQQEKKVLDEKKNKLSTDIKEKQAELHTNKSKIDTIQGQIKALDTKVKETNNKINQAEEEIKQTTREIEALFESIEQLEKKIEERDLVLRERVRAMQINGGSVNYLDVLLGANSFADFIDRFSAVSSLMEADREIMKQQNEDKEQLENEKKLVEQKLSEQEDKKAELEGLKASLDSQKKQKAGLVQELEKEQKKLNTEKASLETAFDEVHEMSKEVEREIVAEQKRMLEIARKAEEERKKQAAMNKPSSPSTGGVPSVSSGVWTKPANGRFTSGFGARVHPITGKRKVHYGVDLANSVGTPIAAAADGVVFRAGWHSSYGNHIMITHSINGATYTTVYAHLSSLGVSAGQVVNKGQVIGGMGSTGNSTGSHLHFELHRGLYSSSNAINPVGIVPL